MSKQRQFVDELIERAERYWKELPSEERDFERARTEFMRRFL